MRDQYVKLKGLMPKIIDKTSDSQIALTQNMLNHLHSLPDAEQKQNEAIKYMNLGIKRFEADDLNGAYDYFEKSGSVFANADAWFHKGLVNYYRDDLARAVVEFTACMTMFEEYDKAYFFRGKSILELLNNTGELNYRTNREMIDLASNDLIKAFEAGWEEAGDLILMLDQQVKR